MLVTKDKKIEFCWVLNVKLWVQDESYLWKKTKIENFYIPVFNDTCDTVYASLASYDDNSHNSPDLCVSKSSKMEEAV